MKIAESICMKIAESVCMTIAESIYMKIAESVCMKIAESFSVSVAKSTSVRNTTIKICLITLLRLGHPLEGTVGPILSLMTISRG